MFYIPIGEWMSSINEYSVWFTNTNVGNSPFTNTIRNRNTNTIKSVVCKESDVILGTKLFIAIPVHTRLEVVPVYEWYLQNTSIRKVLSI